jgi:hypothetical protein
MRRDDLHGGHQLRQLGLQRREILDARDHDEGLAAAAPFAQRGVAHQTLDDDPAAGESCADGVEVLPGQDGDGAAISTC